MNFSYRVRTEVGVDKSVQVDLNQEFDVLEVLSLKIYQRDIYTRVCSDYGVICGRVFANNGFGIPNAKISVFIPLTDEDSNNPAITSVYPFNTLSDVDSDGYRYNLLAKEQSHPGHTPTGTFPTRLEVLIDKNLSEVYEKYYKFSVKTNSAGDYMIFGVPVGSHTIFLDIDLSDIGEFSLSPQDLVRIGLANESQVSGSLFKSSSNLNSLPQIITLNKQVEVLPLWGEVDVCSPSITRTDFDLTSEASVDLTPTAVFMGSIMSTNEDKPINHRCKVNKKVGEFCSLVTGPGQILAIRQTIDFDTDPNSPTYNYPRLEEYKLEGNGYLIDENGTWLIDLPMNLDYVYTNEFGERVISTDPDVGVPTKAKYRFKIKWLQSPSLSEEVRRAYFLVPNIREYGWGNPADNYNDDGNPAINGNGSDYSLYQKSYAFSLDWNDYADPNSAIVCDDTFFLFEYKKVYTVSQLIDKFKNGNGQKYVGIKHITDDACEGTYNKYPVNDAHRGNAIMFLMLNYILSITKFIIFPIIIVMHLVSLLTYIIAFALTILIWVIYAPLYYFIQGVVNIVNWLAPGSPLRNPFKKSPVQLTKVLFEKLIVKKIPIPLLLQSEGDCTFCNCKENEDSQEYENAEAGNFLAGQTNTCLMGLSDGNLISFTTSDLDGSQESLQARAVMAGISAGDAVATKMPTSAYLEPYRDGGTNFREGRNFIFSNQLTYGERINLTNTKEKFYENINRIYTYVEPDLNNNTYHYDNVLVFMADKCLELFTPGKLLTFQDPNLSGDINQITATTINSLGTLQITGTNTSAQTITISFATPASGQYIDNRVYNLPLKESDQYLDIAKFRFDLEYFQVITAITYSELTSYNTNPYNVTKNRSFLNRVIKTSMTINKANDSEDNPNDYDMSFQGSNIFGNMYSTASDSKLIICVRGTDPYSPRFDVKYDISAILGQNAGSVMVRGDYKLNVPVQPGGTSDSTKKRCVRHWEIPTNNDADSSGVGRLFFPSWFFNPGSDFQQFYTSMPKYYGSLDFYTLSSNFNPGGSVYTDTKMVASPTDSIVRVKITDELTEIGKNAFTRHGLTNGYWTFPSLTDDDTYPNTFAESNAATWAAASYLKIFDHAGTAYGESVEGGSFMFMGFNDDNNGGDKWGETTSAYFSPTYMTWPSNGFYNNTGKLLFNTPNNIIFRSDRLPSSTSEERTGTYNSMLLQQNLDFSIYVFEDSGETSEAGGFSSADDIELEGTIFNDGSTAPINDLVIASFSECKNAVPFKCYDIDSDGIVTIEEPVNECIKAIGTSYFQYGKGCYTFVNVPILGIPWDFWFINEWYNRVLLSLFTCMEGIRHDFYNNWVNGNLFMPTIRAVTFYDSDNQPYRNFCSDLVVLHEATQNYYYRSSPYIYDTGFIGARTRNRNNIDIGSGVRGNIRNLKYPTTIVNLGPLYFYTQDLVNNDGYDGYVTNTLTPTTYADVSDLLNFYVISRQLSNGYNMALTLVLLASTIIAGPLGIIALLLTSPMSALFGDRNSNENTKVDADYAQSLTVNSQFGVQGFSPESYPSSDSIRIMVLINPWISFGDTGLGRPKFLIGVFYENDNARRDLISPKRTINNLNANIPLTIADSVEFPQPTQVSPHYQWELDFANRATNLGGFNLPIELNNSEVIFGSQRNDWKTTPESGVVFFSKGMQDLDRLNNTSDYFMTNNTANQKYFKGYIYNVDSNGVLKEDKESITNTVNTTGAPFYFYFGLIKGATAIERFYIKYVDTEIVIE